MIDDLVSRLGQVREWSNRPRVRRVALLIALLVFGAGLYLAWTASGLDPAEVNLWPVLAAAAVVPVSVTGSAWLLKAMTRSTGNQVRWWSALRVVVLGTLSGLAPVSSGNLVRGGAMVFWGATARSAALAIAVDAGIWVTGGLLVSGGALLALGAGPTGLILLAGSVVTGGGTFLLSAGLDRRRATAELLGARTLTISAELARLFACFAALGAPISVLATAALAAASPLSAVFFFLPGGLGIREAFTAAAAVPAQIAPADAFLAAALNRLIGLTVLLIWELSLFVSGRGGLHRGGPEGADPDASGRTRNNV